MATAETIISAAENIRNEIMAISSFAADYKTKETITEVWKDKNSNTFCLRLNNIFYDIITETSPATDKIVRSFAILKRGITKTKPSFLSVVLDQVIEGKVGEDFLKYEWEKISEEIKTISPRNLLSGSYKTVDNTLSIEWADDMCLWVTIYKAGKPSPACKLTDGPLNEEQSKVIKSAIDAYLLRCNKKLNPQEPKTRKPREKKVNATPNVATTEAKTEVISTVEGPIPAPASGITEDATPVTV
jgi:hypothetical protein